MSEGPQGHVEKIVEQSIVEEMQDSFLTYSMSVIMARALPDVRDGLKPSQRRILVAMNDLNLGPRAQTRKCAKICGDTSGNYHPHGESVVYPTLVRMAQPWNFRTVLVDSQGNFGSIDGDPPAAMRYTEARLAPAAAMMLDDLEHETVDYVPNFDNTREEPTVLPGKFPNLLVNGGTGIAVGMATTMAPHNVCEVCDALLAYIDNPEITLPELLKILPGPDFPTGGQICGRRGVVEAYATGRGTITMRGKVEVEESKGGRKTLVISQVPFGVLRSTITEKIAEKVRDGTIKDVQAVNDASDRRHDVRIEIDLKKDANEGVIIRQLFQYTPLQTNFHVLNVALVGKQPKILALKDLLRLYVEHRMDVIRRRTRFLLRRARQRAHLLEGLILALGDIDAIIQLIKESADPETAKARLMARPLRLSEAATLRKLLPESFVKRTGAQATTLTGVQAAAILSMQLQRLTGLEMEKLAKEYVGLVEEIEGYEAILRDDRLVYDIIREDLHEIRDKFPDPRRTEIVEEAGEYTLEELIPNEQVVVTISHQGYIKRVDADTYRKQGRGGKGIRGGAATDEDFVEHLFVVSTHDHMLFFTNRGRVYWLRVFDVPAASRTARGRSLANLLSMKDGERHCAVLTVAGFGEEAFIFFATQKGVVKKTPLQAFSRPRPSGILAITLDEDDTLVDVVRTSGANEVVLGTRKGMAIRFDEDQVRAMGRNARGVIGATLEEGDYIVGLVAAEAGLSLLTICENGYGKRTRLEEYRKTRRGAKGVINIKTTDRNGDVVSLHAVRDDDEMMIITSKGMMLRTGLEAVREIGRATQGVRLIRLDEGDTVVAVARLAKEDQDEPDVPPPGAASASSSETYTDPDDGNADRIEE
ncbi:MAG: DNA topoisomerase (ATP-hydrolyzing) [Planctomycetota bacterium]|nr:MAG: DNA topoisomerase (ATP-hydrolyzing) [Planctomycetota bacterium]